MDTDTIQNALKTLKQLRYDDHGIEKLQYVVFQLELTDCGEIDSIRHREDGSVTYRAASGKERPYSPEMFESHVRLVTFKAREML